MRGSPRRPPEPTWHPRRLPAVLTPTLNRYRAPEKLLPTTYQSVHVGRAEHAHCNPLLMTENIAAEQLLTCLRLEPGMSKLAQLQTLSAADWQAAIDLGSQHGVAPLLFWQVKNIAAQTNLPEDRLAELRLSFRNSALRSLLLYRELATILGALQPAGIPVILLKGLHLAKFIYPEPALRPMADIDLLLQPGDLPRAAQILQGLGYSYLREFKLGREARKHQHIPPLCQADKAPVELHWHIIAPGSLLRVDLDGLWQRAQPAEVEGFPALLLAPEDLLLHLSLHLVHHELNVGLKRVYDIALLVSFYGPRLDWTQVSDRSADWGCRKSLFLVLQLAKILFNAPVPPPVLDQLRPPDFSPQIEALARQRALRVRPLTPELHPDLAHLHRRRPWQIKALALMGALFPYPEYVAAKYSLPPGSIKVYFYYLIRLKDLARRYGWQLWRVLRSDEAVQALAHRENALSDWWMTG